MVQERSFLCGEEVVPSITSESGDAARLIPSSASRALRREVLAMARRVLSLRRLWPRLYLRPWVRAWFVGETGREGMGVLDTDARREPGAEFARKRARSWGVYVMPYEGANVLMLGA
jgi:hypothetical protein